MITSSNIGSPTAPSAPAAGDLWWDTSEDLLKIYSGAGWLIIPAAPAPTADQVLTTDEGGAVAWINKSALP